MKRARQGLSLIDIMVVVLILGLLSGIAIPLVSRTRRQARNTLFISEVRTVAHAVEQLGMVSAQLPSDQAPGVIPPALSDFLPRFDWAAPTPIGGRWDWDYEVFGYKAGVSVYRPDRNDEEMTEIDRKIDDGNLDGGIFKRRTDGYVNIIEK
jgi:type II secretory pathway pseudopilin PulG